MKLQQKKLEKLLFSLKKEYPAPIRVENKPGILETEERSNRHTHAESSYLEEDQNSHKKTAGVTSAVFKSGTKRDPFQVDRSEPINLHFITEIEEEAVRNSSWEKKSFNMKYNKHIRELM